MKKLCVLILVVCMCSGFFSYAEGLQDAVLARLPDVMPSAEPSFVEPVEASVAEEPAPEAEASAWPAETPAPEPSPTAEEIVPESTAAEGIPDTAPSPTPAPEVTETPAATQEAPIESSNPETTPEATPDPEHIEGWLLDADGARMLSGSLEELLAQEGKLQVVVSAVEVVGIKEFPTMRLQEIEFFYDTDVFPGTDWRIVLSRSERLRDEYSPEEIEAAQPGDTAPLFIWVREELPAATEDPSELQLIVHAENVVTGRWSNVQPLFTLEGIGEGSENCDYAVIILDERIAMLSGNSYAPEEEGVYTVRLAIMNEMGDLVDRSEKYTLWLDWSAPEMMIEVSMEKDRTMNIYAGDRVSGVAGLSMDGGESWFEIEDVFTYTAPEKQSFAPGMIQLKDNAGNITINDSEIVLKKIPSYGGGSGSVSKDHAAGDGDTASYSAYALDIPAGEMMRLALGGEEIELQLVGIEEEKEQELPFRAELICWAGRGAAGAGGSPDTLVLHASGELQDTAVWKINGAVLRKLYNSDIAYLVLEQEGEMLSLPTIGFTAGTRYAELKMMGAATQEFSYEIHMKLLEEERVSLRPGFNQSARLLPAIWVEVDGERYQMLDRESTPEMYFYDVYCAPADLPDYPYGAYPGTNPDGETEAE